MKKIILLAILLLATAISTFSQTGDKGSIELGGTTNGNFAFHLDGNFFNANINPLIGYHVTDNLVLGAGVNLRFYKSGDFHDTFYRFGPYVRYYFGKEGKLKPYAIIQAGSENKYFQNADYGYGYGSFGSANSFFWESGVGLSYWIKPNIGLTTEISYHANSLNKYIDKGDLDINFGVLFKFNTK